MTVQTTNRTNSQNYSSGINTKFPGGALCEGKNPIEQRFDPVQNKVSINSNNLRIRFLSEICISI